jgi:putative membrane protein
MAEAPKKLLILVVDRDDDVGRKASISTPIIGFEENLKAAQVLLLADPEEADANAIFGALKVYREISEKLGGHIEVATVAGKEGEGIEADMKIMSELEEVLKRFKADACVLVSDGVTDQFVTPLITSKLPIISVRRVIVRHSEAVEQTWLVLGRYLKLVFTEPRYSKIFLGIPGLLMAIIGVLYVINVASLPFILSAIGIYFIIRGFGLDQKVASSFKNVTRLFRMPPYTQLRAYAAFTSALLLIIGFYTGYISSLKAVQESYPEAPEFSTHVLWWLEKIPFIAGTYISSSIDIVSIAIFITLLANMVYYLFIRDPSFWLMVRGSVLLAWLWALLKRTGIVLVVGASGGFENPHVLLLIVTAILGMATIIVTIWITRILRKAYSKYFRRRMGH